MKGHLVKKEAESALVYGFGTTAMHRKTIKMPYKIVLCFSAVMAVSNIPGAENDMGFETPRQGLDDLESGFCRLDEISLQTYKTESAPNCVRSAFAVISGGRYL